MASSMTSAPMVANFREPVVPHLLRLRRIDRETMHGGDLEISFGQIRIMSSRPVLGFPAKKLLVVLPFLTALACVDLTPPWERNRGRDAGKDMSQAGHTEGTGGASGGTGGSGGIGGASGSGVVDAAVPPGADSNSEPDVPFAPESDASDARQSDARVDRYAAGGATADAARDVPVDVTGGRGGTSAGGAGGSTPSSSRRGGRTTGGATTGGTVRGGSSARGGSASGGSATGGSGGDAGVADAPSHCTGVRNRFEPPRIAA